MIEEILKDYYGLENVIINKRQGYFEINMGEKIFLLYKIYSNEEVIKAYKLSLLVDYSNIFIYNLFSNIITTVDNSSYVLLYEVLKKKISPITSFYQTGKKSSLNWRKLWIEKSNYIESYFNSIHGKYPLIDESIPYYMGFMELAIDYLKDYDNYIGEVFIEHKVLNERDYFNPFNLLEDQKERDFAEYLKYIFFEKDYNNIDITELIQNGNGIFEYNLVIARIKP